jgi:hypothetical protein
VNYFIDTHDRTKGSFPKEELTEQQFFDNSTHWTRPPASSAPSVHPQGARAINFPYDSITEVRRVTGADMRIPQPAEAQKRKAVADGRT